MVLLKHYGNNDYVTSITRDFCTISYFVIVGINIISFIKFTVVKNKFIFYVYAIINKPLFVINVRKILSIK